MYQKLINEKFSSEINGNTFINTVLDARQKINSQKLKAEKYNLIAEIKKSYNIDKLFTTRIGNYKLLASISQLFEHQIGNTIDPLLYARSKEMLLESVQIKKVEEKQEQDIDEYIKLDKGMRALTYSLLVENFNGRYANLNNDQKKLLTEYVNNLTDSQRLTQYINDEIMVVKDKLNRWNKQIEDTVIKIKINEIQTKLKPLASKMPITDKILEELMLSYELCDSIEETLNN